MLAWQKRRFIDNLWGPAGTIIIHLLILLVLVKFMHFEGRALEREVEVVIKDVEVFEELDDIEEELDELDDIPTVVDAVAPPSVSTEAEPPPVDAMAPGAEDVDLGELDMMEAVSPLTFKGLYRSRSAAGRQNALGKYGGGMGQRTEYAVKKALEWLRDHQYPDGSWGPQYRVSMTGLSLLAFFAHGETTASPEYGAAIRKGLKYLLKQQKKGTFIGGGSHYGHEMTPLQIRSYEHAIGTYAISEAYGLTSIPFLKYAMEDAIQVIIDGQHAGGSWDYGYVQGPDSHIDVSLAGWHIQALKAAKMAGAHNPGLGSAIESAVRGLKVRHDTGKTGMFQYSTREETHKADTIMTGVAVLCMQLVGHALDAESREGLDVLKNLNFRWTLGAEGKGDERRVGKWPVYAWYYITQARFHQGGRTWVTWNKQFAPGLCLMQNADGSWCPTPSTSETRFGPVYHTALCALMLEVYYRFLPTFQPIDLEKDAIEEEDAGDDEIVIKFG